MENTAQDKSSKGKVLIVDDASDTVEIIHKLLSYEGFRVLTAQTGEEGVKKVGEEKPEIAP